MLWLCFARQMPLLGGVFELVLSVTLRERAGYAARGKGGVISLGACIDNALRGFILSPLPRCRYAHEASLMARSGGMHWLCWYSSVVERHLGKVEVLGSSPSTSSGGARHLAGSRRPNSECRMLNDELRR